METAVLAERIDQMHRSLIARVEQSERRHDERADRQDAVLGEVLENVKLTNGRVTTIEKAREYEAGQEAAKGRISGWVQGVASGAIVGAIVLLLEHGGSPLR